MSVKHNIFAFLRVVLALVLFGLFGALCAFVYLGFFVKSPFSREIVAQTSLNLAEFLDNASQKKISFNEDELVENVGGFVAKCANSKFFAATPMLRILDDKLLVVGIPVIFNGIMQTRVYNLSFCFDENLRLKKAYFGAARIPLFFARMWGAEILSHYESSPELKKQTEKLGKTLKLKMEKNSVLLEKCD